MAQAEPFDMCEKERDVLKEVTTRECGDNCQHCVHTDTLLRVVSCACV